MVVMGTISAPQFEYNIEVSIDHFLLTYIFFPMFFVICFRCTMELKCRPYTLAKDKGISDMFVFFFHVIEHDGGT